MAISNVALTDTFDTWRTRTNQLAVLTNDIDANNVLYFVSNSSSLSVTSTSVRKGNIYFQINVSNTTSDLSTTNVASANSVNTAHVVAWNAYNKANAANIFANSVNITAISAYAKANAALPNATGVFSGTLSLTSGNLSIGTAYATTKLTVVDNAASLISITGALGDFGHNANSYIQLHLRNANAGTNASGDLVITGDTGDDFNDFIDVGINSSGFAQSWWTVNGVRDGYLYVGSQNLSIGAANTNKSVNFFAGGTLTGSEVFRIDSFNRMGIGTKAPTSRLHVVSSGSNTALTVVGAGGGTLAWDSAGSSNTNYSMNTHVFSSSNGAIEYVRILPSGNVGIGTVVAPYKLTVQGDIYAYGDITAFSDAAIKTDVVTITDALNTVNALRGVRYTRVDNQQKKIGLIAQEVQKVVPELVVNNDNNIGVSYQTVVALLIEAVKELSDKVKVLEGK